MEPGIDLDPPQFTASWGFHFLESKCAPLGVSQLCLSLWKCCLAVRSPNHQTARCSSGELTQAVGLNSFLTHSNISGEIYGPRRGLGCLSPHRKDVVKPTNSNANAPSPSQMTARGPPGVSPNCRCPLSPGWGPTLPLSELPGDWCRWSSNHSVQGESGLTIPG